MYYLDFSYTLEYRQFKKEKVILQNNGWDYYVNINIKENKEKILEREHCGS